MANKKKLKPEEIIQILNSLPDDVSECDEEEQFVEEEETDSEGDNYVPESDSSSASESEATVRQITQVRIIFKYLFKIIYNYAAYKQ